MILNLGVRKKGGLTTMARSQNNSITILLGVKNSVLTRIVSTYVVIL